MKKIITDTTIYVIVLLALLLIWFVCANAINMSIVLPTPNEVGTKLTQLLVQRRFWQSVGSTLLRTAIAFALSVVVALVTSLLAKCVPVVGKVLSPIVTILRTVPTLAVILIAIVLISTSSAVAVVVAFLIVFPVCYSAFCTTLLQTEQIDKALDVFGVSKWNRVLSVYLPTLRNQIVEQFRTNLPLSLKVVIAGEVLAFPLFGIGREMYYSQANLQTASLFAYTIIALVIAFVTEIIVFALAKIITNKGDKA